ncbi:MAG: hypothetical protein M0T72_08430 [Candidatus Dormibacteraeota bacterium]|nr:hypothetical protein [Candidatus Dormibacteraeota bacterium]
MSWSFGAKIPAEATVSTDIAAEVLEEARRGFEAMGIDLEEESRHQITVAVNEAAAIAASGALGHKYPLSVSMSGHSNPRHEERTGWANEQLTISIVQTPPREGD